MKLSNENFNGKKEIKSGWTITRMITWVILFCVLIVTLVLTINNKDSIIEKTTGASQEAKNSKTEIQLNLNDKTSEDLQIWDDPESELTVVSEPPEANEATDLKDIEEENEYSEDDLQLELNEVPKGFFRITLENGEFETHKINTYIPESTYSFDQFEFSGKNSFYNFEDSSKSYMGIKVSKENGYIDFIKVKKDGIDFVMIAAGSRGYGTGQLVLDDYAKEHIKNATDANLNIGLYFRSQAITEEEAIEEANQVLNLVTGYTITYPIAFEMDRIYSDEGRTEDLSRTDRTKIALAFLSTIKEANYDTCIYGNSEFLIDYIELSQLKSYDLWLDQEASIPEIPYRFSIWEFSKLEKINGVSGLVPVSISLIDFQSK